MEIPIKMDDLGGKPTIFGKPPYSTQEYAGISSLTDDSFELIRGELVGS